MYVHMYMYVEVSSHRADLITEGDKGHSVVGVGGGEGVYLVIHCCLNCLG